MEVIRYESFAKAQHDWETLEKNNAHYPFQSWWYQHLFATHFSEHAEIFILGIRQDKQLLAIGAFEIVEGKVQFLGTKDVSKDPDVVQDLTDFGDILYSKDGKMQSETIWHVIFTYFTQQGYSSLQLRYVRQDSPTYSALAQKTLLTKQETSPFVQLPETWEDYLAGLERKKRHELKRKIHRLTEVKTIFTKNSPTNEIFENFIKLHKLSDVEKEKFMTAPMEKFFWDMVTVQKYHWDTAFYTLSVDGKPAAMVMVFENKDQVLLYNSGFNPEFAHFSVGLLVKALLLKKSIEQKKTIYDLLRGSERYKYDLGAKDMPLFQIHGSVSR